MVDLDLRHHIPVTEIPVANMSKHTIALLAASFIFLLLFIAGFIIEVGKGELGIAQMLAAIFYCLVAQGWRKQG